ncbi:YetF domain-containing protein [Methanolobus sp.]|uniref:DUF421 domain-containing protein n=1 Tax=Methanolobus sp. TaxID=1874737 RepID=UPI0025E25207|nr:YetF domain-containing protein [Methanolobus sp.]
MPAGNIEPFDLGRILFASTPAGYLLEVAFRTVVIFIVSLIFMRLLGRRAVEQLTPFDLLIIIALGSAMGDPMFYPEVSLLWGTIVMMTAVALFQIQDFLMKKSSRYEDITQGTPVKVIENGIIDRDRFDRTTTTKDELLLMLRKQGIRHMGELEKVYLERDGGLSIYKLEKDKQQPGLTVIPLEVPGHPKHYLSGTKVPRSAYYSCFGTGETRRFSEGETFPNCRENEWVEFIEP